ncbi:hypothetical protein AVEN_225802-1 [Araneus ventricosus]|uniref:Uncharacterized protein n=1 Tax=Araneus ventricosus TaxID=182803 RepID=A0A4Y2BB16_ARAVE|nr:hypothetical protein AVEN_225802-1 [Araneus ventricosus]
MTATKCLAYIWEDTQHVTCFSSINSRSGDKLFREISERLVNEAFQVTTLKGIATEEIGRSRRPKNEPSPLCWKLSAKNYSAFDQCIVDSNGYLCHALFMPPSCNHFSCYILYFELPFNEAVRLNQG